MLGNGAPCCSVSDGENNFGILKMYQSSGRALSRVGGRVGFRTPGCVQVLVRGAEDLARTACSTFPHECRMYEGEGRALVKYGVSRSPKFIWAPVYSFTHWLTPQLPLPPPRIWAHM
jgi:hypothetical protein